MCLMILFYLFLFVIVVLAIFCCHFLPIFWLYLNNEFPLALSPAGEWRYCSAYRQRQPNAEFTGCCEPRSSCVSVVNTFDRSSKWNNNKPRGCHHHRHYSFMENNNRWLSFPGWLTKQSTYKHTILHTRTHTHAHTLIKFHLDFHR